MAAAEQEAPQAAGQQQLCQECGQQAAKYCCPRCDRRTCSLGCVKAHKEATGCSGKRNRTAFVGRAEFDERTFMSDYRFLEEVQLAEDVAKRSKPPAPKLEMPQFLQTLQYQARRRGVQLHILSPGMEKRRTNTTRYDGRMQLLSWHVEWSFPAAGCKAADTKVHENTVMADLLRGHLALQPGAAAKYHALREYREAGMEALTVLLRKERTPANAVRYYEVDVSRPLRQQLAGKVIVEFPTFVVLLPHERDSYTVLPLPAAGDGAAAAAAGAAAAEPAAGGMQPLLAERNGPGAAATGAAAVPAEGPPAGAAGGAAALQPAPPEASAAALGAEGQAAAVPTPQASPHVSEAGQQAAAAAAAPAAT